MILFPLMLSLIIAVVDFAGAIYIIGRYTKRYESREIGAAAVISVATLLLCVIVFYGEYVISGKMRDEILGSVMIVIVALAAAAVYKGLSRKTTKSEE